MRRYLLRLIGLNGEPRIERTTEQPTPKAVWRELATIAEAHGLDGEFLQVMDENDEMVIRVGVATARSTLPQAA